MKFRKSLQEYWTNAGPLETILFTGSWIVESIKKLLEFVLALGVKTSVKIVMFL
jgi:hypothetical protein